jgi:hypothetical protein
VELELALHLYMCDVKCLVHRHDERDLVLHLRGVRVVDVSQNHRDGRVVHVLVLRRCICVVRELELRHDVSDLVLHHHDEILVRVNQSHHDVHDLQVRHRVGRVVHELALRRCICVVRELDDHLHNGPELREFQLAFPHPYAVVYRKDSKLHCCAWRHELRRVEIRRDCEHLDRAVHEVREIQPYLPWYLAWHASWQRLSLLQHGEQIRPLAWIRYRGRGLVLAFGRAAFS